MKVVILNKNESWLDNCWVATRTCKSAKTPMELKKEAEQKPYEDKLRLMKAIFNSGHLSIFEHASVTFGVSGASRALLAQFTRHRIGWSYSVQSQRYVSMASADVVFPRTLDKSTNSIVSVGEGVVGFNDRKDWDSVELFKRAVGLARNAYGLLVCCGIPKEDARMVLPMGTTCNIVTSCNLRALLDIYHKRVEVKGAQWEIREMVAQMMDLVCETEPWVRELVGE